MIREIVYVNSRGDAVTFGGDKSPWRFGAGDIFNLEQQYNSVGGVITSFTRPTQDRSLRVFMRSGTLAERNRFEDVLSYDSRVVQHGTLYAGASHLKCYANNIEEADWHYFDGMLTADITFAIDKPSWVRAHSTTLSTTNIIETGGHNFPHNFPHNFKYSADTSTILTNPFMLPAHCDIVFPGPCVWPYVIIGGNRHQVKASAEKGQLIIVKGFDMPRDIVLRSVDGIERSIFAQGVREPGAQIFGEIPVGDSVAAWSGSYNIEVTMYEERKSPWWT